MFSDGLNTLSNAAYHKKSSSLLTRIIQPFDRFPCNFLTTEGGDVPRVNGDTFDRFPCKFLTIEGGDVL